jgi:hypothetical protein
MNPMPTPDPEWHKKKPGRLAFREEGTLWVAYYALHDTMQGAIFLGSLPLAFVVRDPIRKDMFMDLMMEAVADILEDATGSRPVWGDPRTAPEHERGGNA